jgi:hypothetical protein
MWLYEKRPFSYFFLVTKTKSEDSKPIKKSHCVKMCGGWNFLLLAREEGVGGEKTL